ncbi:MAG: hypothetical protein M1820_009830 [Bogoriella megaspora]|nr:MAG: hypothetical protein M1820_009830 [Bogoriella megaspora]
MASRISKLPAQARFLLFAVLSLASSTILSSILSVFTGPSLAALGPEPSAENDTSYVFLLLGWRLIELAVGWFLGFDDVDIFALTTISQTPLCFLLWSFYRVPLPTIGLKLLIDIASFSGPMALLRPAPTQTANAYIVRDRPIQIFSSLLATCVYSVSLLLFLRTSWLPYVIIEHFYPIASMEITWNASIANLVPLLIPLGAAAHMFMFAPSVAAQKKSAAETEKLRPFDPETASLLETVKYNLGFDRLATDDRAKILVGRTLVAVLFSSANVVIRALATVKGVDAGGVLGWMMPWVAATAATGFSYFWVGKF